MIRDREGAGFLAPYLPPLRDGVPVQRWHFASLAAFAAAAPATPPAHAWYRSTWEADTAWYGATMRQAHRFAREGWQDGAARVLAITERVRLLSPQRPRIARWDVAGSVASVPRHLAGNPLAMRRIVTDDTRRRPVLTLLATLGAPSNVEAADYERSAAIAAAVVDRLEDAGYRCEVIGASRIADHPARHHADRFCEVAFIAKRAEDALDVATLAFALGHPALARRLTHALFQTGTRLAAKSIGFTCPFSDAPNRPDATYTLPGAGDYPDNDLAAFRIALDSLRHQGCPGIPETLAA